MELFIGFFMVIFFRIEWNLKNKSKQINTHRIRMYGIYGNIWGILMVNVTTKIAYIRIRHGICCFEKKTHGQSSHDKKKRHESDRIIVENP